MELQVQELLERIKSEGIDSAKAEAGRIIAEAEAKAAAMLEDAEKAASQREEAARIRIQNMENASRVALSQASRDTILALKDSVQDFFDNLIVASAGEALNASFIQKILPEILKEMAKNLQGDIVVSVPEKIHASLDQALAARMAKELSKGVEFKVFPGIDAGFRISEKNSTVQYDFSAEAVATIISARLNARLSEIVNESVKGSRNP
ncbi:MAG: hypothetical protein LWX00_07890 [Spirochaetia bacterium]|nr:hypothetical protein [Spirochaetia bacterium]